MIGGSQKDLGRPVSHITQNFTGVDLANDAEKVLKGLSPLEKEVRGRDGRWYTVRILPYRTLDDRIDGVVVTFSDVSRLKETENHLRYEKTYAERITETVRHPLLVLDNQLRVLSANRAFHETFQIDPGQMTGQKVYDLGNRQWDNAAVSEPHRQRHQVPARGTPGNPYRSVTERGGLDDLRPRQWHRDRHEICRPCIPGVSSPAQPGEV